MCEGLRQRSVYSPNPVLAEHRAQRRPVLPIGKHRAGIIDVGYRTAKPRGHVTVQVAHLNDLHGASDGVLLPDALQHFGAHMQVVHGHGLLSSG